MDATAARTAARTFLDDPAVNRKTAVATARAQREFVEVLAKKTTANEVDVEVFLDQNRLFLALSLEVTLRFGNDAGREVLA